MNHKSMDNFESDINYTKNRIYIYIYIFFRFLFFFLSARHLWGSGSPTGLERNLWALWVVGVGIILEVVGGWRGSSLGIIFLELNFDGGNEFHKSSAMMCKFRCQPWPVTSRANMPFSTFEIIRLGVQRHNLA